MLKKNSPTRFFSSRESKEALVQSGQIVSGEAAWAHCVRYRIVRCPWHQVANACIEWPLLSAIAENGKHMKVFTDKFPLAVGGTGMRFLIASWVALHPSCMQILRAGMPSFSWEHVNDLFFHIAILLLRSGWRRFTFLLFLDLLDTRSILFIPLSSRLVCNDNPLKTSSPRTGCLVIVWEAMQ